MDVYGYCLDDPINFIDRTGLFVFGKRRLKGLEVLDSPVGKALNGAGKKVLDTVARGPVSDKIEKELSRNNLELKHEHGFFEDEEGGNIGKSDKGRITNETKKGFKFERQHYDDKRMRRAAKNLKEGEYDAVSNNCQDFKDKLLKEYHATFRSDNLH